MLTGVDIDALWIDMNEPSNFCEYPCSNPDARTTEDAKGLAAGGGSSTKSLSTKKVHDEEEAAQSLSKRKSQHENNLANVKSREIAERQNGGSKKGLPGRDLINPQYKIQNAMGSLSNKTANTDLVHQGGWTEYDTHNLYVFMTNERRW
jgi:alpha-glucosidase